MRVRLCVCVQSFCACMSSRAHMRMHVLTEDTSQEKRRKKDTLTERGLMVHHTYPHHLSTGRSFMTSA